MYGSNAMVRGTGFASALVLFGFFGLVGILPDADHVYCLVAKHLPLTAIRGCKPLHLYLLDLVGLLGCVAFALVAGYVLGVLTAAASEAEAAGGQRVLAPSTPHEN